MVTITMIKLGQAQLLHVVRRTPEVLEIISTWRHGGDPPRTHWHPAQHEHFEVLAGRLTVELGSEPPVVIAAGEVIDVPPRTAHRMWNASAVETVARWTITPALRTEEMFRAIDRAGSLRKIWLAFKFRHEFRVGTPS